MHRFRSIRSSFWLKVLLAASLVAMADTLFWAAPGGATAGAFAAALALAAAFVHPAIDRDRRAILAGLAAVGFAALLVDRPTLLCGTLFCVALAVAVLSSRMDRGQGAGRWLLCLALGFIVGLAAPLNDWGKLAKRRRGQPAKRRIPIGQFLLPVIGGGIFLALFAAANPIIATALTDWRQPEIDPLRGAFWLMAGLGVWMALRPRFVRWPLALPGAAVKLERPGVTVLSVGLSLVLFNLLFALENGLDIAFLWSGAALPQGVTLASYAHRGAYTLIVTAILAGGFVLFALRPGSTTAGSRPLRALVVLWVAQNLLLVASSILRTLDYVQAYSLTCLRIAALIWMGLVGLGLVLICWRLLRGKSSAWLVNANVLAAAMVLAGCCVVDIGAITASWNVRHASEAGGAGADLDLDYLRSLGPSALVPVSELAGRPLPYVTQGQVERLRRDLLADLRTRQADWRGWTWRGQRRLDRAEALRPTVDRGPMALKMAP